jgi:hypothetical protein
MGCSVGQFLASCFGTCYCCLWTGLLGLDSRGTVERQRVWYENDERNDMTRSKWQESGTKLSNNQFARLGQGACTSLFIVGVQQFYYNALKAPNHLHDNRVYGKEGNLDYYIRSLLLVGQWRATTCHAGRGTSG